MLTAYIKAQQIEQVNKGILTITEWMYIEEYKY